MNVLNNDGVVVLDGRFEGRNVCASETFNQIQWIFYMRGLWHRVTVFDGWRHGKDIVMRTILASIAPDELWAINYQQDGANAVFIVNACGTALRKLCQNNLRVFNQNSRKELVLQLELRYPITQNICIRSLLGKVISTNMYNGSEKVLSMSKFHKNPELDKTMYCPLHLKRVTEEVLHVLSGLNVLYSLRVLILSNNGLASVQNFSYLFQNAPNLKVLDLQDNMLPEMACLDRIRGCQLHELFLDGNALCELYEDEAKYIDDVRAIFPSIVKLDGVCLPPKGFPVSLRNYVCNPDGDSFIEQFIFHYYNLYDGWNGRKTRLDLLGTYSKEALFSLSCASVPLNSGVAIEGQPVGRLGKYFSESRNLLKMSDYIKCNKYLHFGRQNIVKFLSEMPLTEHDRSSVCVDMTNYTDTNVVVSVRGVLRELDSMENSAFLCSFNRVFVLWRHGDNYFISNDMLFITNVTEQQAEASRRSLPPVSSNPFTESDPLPNLDDKNYEIKQNMVEELAKATEMNLRWSRKCLVETEWDFQEALIIFMELYKDGTIPAEAFKL